jgi:hypothetical protein
MLKKLFKGVQSLVKKAAPVIGAAAPFLFPGAGFMGGALTGGIASLIGGAKPQEALRSALLAGAGSKFLSPGAKSLQSGAGLVDAAKSVGKVFNEMTLADKLLYAGTAAGIGATTPAPKVEEAEEVEGITPGQYGTLFDFEEALEQPVFVGPNDPIQYYAEGGQVSKFPRKTGMIRGPGTETSDDIPAMLSNNEFVMTAKAVKGLGSLLGGKNEKQKIEIGTEGMYGIMDRFSRQA